MWKPLKIKSSVLQLSILVAVMVAVLLLSFITLNHTHAFFRIKSENLLQQLHQNENVFFTDETPAEKVTDSSVISPSYRGGFQLLASIAKNPQGDLKKIGLIGTKASEEKQLLYVQDHQNPLVLAGNSTIFGPVKIPSGGVKSGVISGTYYQGKTLIHGSIQYSSASLPALENEFSKYLNMLQKIPLAENQEIVTTAKPIKNSFWNPEKIQYNQGSITIYDQAIGNIQYQSANTITVSKNALLTDVLLVAPIIKIEKGFRGRIHAVATDSIIIEEHVNLDYPSSLVLKAKQGNEQSAQIVVNDHSRINGNIIFINTEKTEERASHILLSEKAVVQGAIYCEGYLEHYGTIYGNVYTSYFLSKAKGSVYINHILDGDILPLKNKQLSHLPLVNSEKSSVQWLY